jgi:hemerythrin-like metal-binding protein
MELGEELMDGEHAAQLRLLDSFEQSLRDGDDHDQLVIALDRLVEFTNLHFMSEEGLMERHAYPEIDLHIKEHDFLLDRARTLQKAFNKGDQPLTEGELAALREWLLNHIRTRDLAFALYLKKLNTI